MRSSFVTAVCASGVLTVSFVAGAVAQTLDANRISGPLVHENLAVYFIHGSSAPGKVPLTLEEAMASGAVKVRETSNVNQLEIENLGDHEVFVQSGERRKTGSHVDGQPFTAAPFGDNPHRLILRGGRALDGTRP